MSNDKPPATISPTDTSPTTGDFAVIVGKQAVQTGAVYKGLAAVIEPLSTAFHFAARRTPVIGAVMSTMQATGEIAGDIKDSKFGKAGAATVAGIVEVGGNILGFGIGDSAREIVRSAIIKTAGEEYAVEKSDLRTASETVGAAAAGAKASAEQAKIDEANRDMLAKERIAALGKLTDTGTKCIPPKPAKPV